MKRTIIGARILAVIGMAMCAPTAGPTAREDLGRTVKFAILVDKVMQREAKGTTEEWMVKEAAEAGFNVYSPREGHERLDEVRQVAEWCRKYGIYHMPWMRGSLPAPDGPRADGKRVLWANGIEQPLWSPNSDEFWEWTSKYIIEYARISVKNEHLIGIFLDYENYAPRRQGDLYSLSYDNIIMRKFARAQNLDLPELAPKKRRSWLEARGLHKEFETFQIAHWRERTRALRQAVDELNSAFQFCVYPAPGTPFILEAIYPEWATETAPLILADASVYGRFSRFLPHKEALKDNRRKLLERMRVPKKRGISFIYVGGIDPVVQGADPEFSGKNAITISDVTNGYWVFYEGPTYGEKDHTDYWKWFRWANQAIAGRDFVRQYEPRKIPDDWGLKILDKLGDTSRLAAPTAKEARIGFPSASLRGDNIMLIAASADSNLELVLRNKPVGRYHAPLVWNLRRPNRTTLAFGSIPHGETGTVAFRSDRDGIYLLGVSAGRGAYSVIRSNAPIGLYAGDKLAFISGAKRLYFQVPNGLKDFTLEAKGWRVETVRVNVYDPDQERVATGQTTPRRPMAIIRVPVGDRPTGTWSLEITQADEGVLEDNSIKLGPNLPPVLSFLPQHVFGFAPPE
jgi:hypothetical protein